MTHPILTCLLVISFGCLNIPANKTSTGKKEEITAKLKINKLKISNPDDFKAELTIINGTDTTVELWCWTLDYSTLCLEVINEKGEKLNPMPPSVPPCEMEIKNKIRVLKPSQKLKFNFVSTGIFRDNLKKGKYKIRFSTRITTGKTGNKSIDLNSEWLRFEII